jgi:membrane-bound lytic murein transglycosylase D
VARIIPVSFGFVVPACSRDVGSTRQAICNFDLQRGLHRNPAHFRKRKGAESFRAERMAGLTKIRNGKWVLLAACVLAVAGCNDTAKKQIAVKAPAPTPVPVAKTLGVLPLPDASPDTVALRQGDSRPALDLLMERAQAAFDAGQAETAAGQPDKAQADYNRALDLILKSGLPADSDPQLSKLFDQIGDVIHADEGAMATNGDPDAAADTDDAETPSQPAPIDEIADLTLPAGDPRLAAKAEKELISVQHDLPLTVNESVLQYLSFFTTTKGRAIVEHGLERRGQYEPMIRTALREEGVPEDLMYLAQAESAFLPQAVSRAGARGIWQFMPYRATEYDLDRTYWIDERSDPEKATHAAARHMRDLYEMFGDWYLVMAAYNSGPLNVTRAVERTGYADFWELQKRHALPKETQNYVPIIIAMALVGKDPAAYGIHVSAAKPAATEALKPGASIDLHLVADATGTDLDDLHALNPALLRNVTPGDPNFELKVPAGTSQKFEANIQQVPEEKWTSWRLHAVAQGESLSDVARQYHVTMSAIEAANQVDGTVVLPAGFLLSVPAAPAVSKLLHYRVRRGDTLEGIAGRYDVTVDDLRRWNHLRGNSAPRGVSLRIYAGGEPSAPAKAKSAADTTAPAEPAAHVQKVGSSEGVTHKVKPGETLYSIARIYGTTVSALRQSNSFLLERSLQAGDVLMIQR